MDELRELSKRVEGLGDYTDEIAVLVDERFAALSQRIKRLEAKQTKEPEPAPPQTKEPEVDWSQMAGRLVEVRDSEHHGWRIRVFEKRGCGFYYTQNSCAWNYCRPYTGPLRPNLLPYDGGKGPVARDVLVVARLRNGGCVAGFAGMIPWFDVDGYQVIEP